MTVQTTEPAAPTGFAAAGFGPVARRKLEIRQVWAHNVEREFALIRVAAEHFRYVAMDTEFPGTIYYPNPSKNHRDHTPSERYAALKANVDALHLIQVGLAFAASPDTPPCLAFEINLREFDPCVHAHNPSSIALLTDHGLDFAAHRSRGVEARVFATLLMSSGLVCAGDDAVVTWVAFASSYDFGYLLKLLVGRDLPDALPEFLRLVRVFFGDEVYDVKQLLANPRCRYYLPGGLEKAAASLNVKREAGGSHQAGSDSALTWDTFRRIRDGYFGDEGVRRFAGVLHGLELHLDVAAPAPNSNGHEKSNKYGGAAAAPAGGHGNRDGSNGNGGHGNRHGSNGNRNGGRTATPRWR